MNQNGNGDVAMNNGNAVVNDEEAMLAQALAMSMETDEKSDENANDNPKMETDDVENIEQNEQIVIVDEPAADEENVCSIQLRLPQNKRLERRFKAEHTLQDVANFVKAEEKGFKNIVFVCPPMNSYDDMELTLE